MASLSSFPLPHVYASFQHRCRKLGLNDAVCYHYVHPLDHNHRRRKLHSMQLASPRAAGAEETGTDSNENISQSTQSNEASPANSGNPSKLRSAKSSQLKPKVRSAIVAQSAFGKAAEYIRKRQLGAFDKDAPPLEDPIPPPQPPPGPLPEVEIIRGSMKPGAQRADELVSVSQEEEARNPKGGDASKNPRSFEKLSGELGTVSQEEGINANGGDGSRNPSRSSEKLSGSPVETPGSVAEDSSRSSEGENVSENPRSFDKLLSVTEATPGPVAEDAKQSQAPEMEKKVLTALEKAAKYKRERGGMAAAGGVDREAGVSRSVDANLPEPLDYKARQENATAELLAAAQKLKLKNEAASVAKEIGKPADEGKYVEVEIVTRDGVRKNRVRVQDQGNLMSSVRDPRRKGVSSVDFKGLNFADKRQSSGPPPGLRESFSPPPSETDLPEVEIITRSASQGMAAGEAEEGDDLYKPKVSTWGVFPRPQNISRAFGGGKNIQPGQSLETEEERKQREEKTRRLLEDYRRKAGLDITPKVLAACDQAMKTGKALMDTGRLNEALPFFEDIIRQTVFNSELHGLAALQKAVCLDSMARSDEARQLYERLANHTNGGVRKKATQMLFGFQAARKLKLEGKYKFDSGLYTRYFSAFSDGYNTMYKASPEDAQTSTLMQALPYIAFLLFPLILVAYIALSKGS